MGFYGDFEFGSSQQDESYVVTATDLLTRYRQTSTNCSGEDPCVVYMEPQAEYTFAIGATFQRPINALFSVDMLGDDGKAIMSKFVSFDQDDKVAQVWFTMSEQDERLPSSPVAFRLRSDGSKTQEV